MNSSVELLVLRQRCFDSEIHLVAHFFIYFFSRATAHPYFRLTKNGKDL